MKQRLGWGLLLLAFLAVVGVAVMVFGARLGLWLPGYGFGLARTYVAPIGYVVLGASVLGGIYLLLAGQKAGAMRAGLAALIGVALLFPTLQSTFSSGKNIPLIHDITTDTDNPPVFLVLDDTRRGAKNSLVYGGEKIARIQQDSYPDIQPLRTDLSADQAFQMALMTARDMGWTIVAQDEQERRFEATARTAIFHFADDVVVVVTPENDESRVDMRSVSRIGLADMGANAERIRQFQQAFAE